jgi:2-dehydropantoate 2-reductase
MRNISTESMSLVNSTVYILGAGAIGKALAVFLSNSHRNVMLVRTSIDHYAMREESCTVELHDGSSLQASVPICALAELSALKGIIVLANKAHANEAIAKKLMNKTGNSPLIVMQNGLDVEKSFLENFDTVYRCVLFATSEVTSSQRVRFKPVHPSPIGVVKGDPSTVGSIIQLLDTGYFEFCASDNIIPTIWKKTIANCVFNSICPLLEVDNGLFHRNETARLLANRVIHECVSLAKEAGIQLDPEDILQMVLMISRASDGNLISTLQDIRHGRDTEIESLNFAITAIATGLNKTMLVAETRLLGELTRLKASVHKRVQA